jgi:hypothetical protein
MLMAAGREVLQPMGGCAITALHPLSEREESDKSAGAATADTLNDAQIPPRAHSRAAPNTGRALGTAAALPRTSAQRVHEGVEARDCAASSQSSELPARKKKVHSGVVANQCTNSHVEQGLEQ